MSNVYEKLNQAREIIHSGGLRKSGSMANSRGGYFELSDFIQPALSAFKQVGLCGVVSFPNGTARLTITDIEAADGVIVIESPMGSANLKGCHEVQNIGAVQTYQRRYLWMAALEIVEHDAIDAAVGRGEEPAPPPTITDDQHTELVALFDATGFPVARFLETAKIDDLRKLPAERFDGARKWINEQAKELENA